MPETPITTVYFGEAITWTDFNVDGHSYANDGNSLVYINNTTGSDVTLTHVEQAECDFAHPANNETDVATAGGITRIWRGKNVVRWNDSSGSAHITVPAAPGDATLQVAVVSYAGT